MRSMPDREPFPIGNNKALFVDHLHVERAQGVRLRLHPPTKTGERLLVSDRPWEDATLNWFGVLKDGRRYRMWYEAYDVAGWPTSDDTSFCHAESDDGIHWRKTNLGLTRYRGVRDTNILFRQIGGEGYRSRVHGACVYLDPNAPRAERYKCVSQGQFHVPSGPPHRIAGMTSPDGLHWKRLPRPICDGFADSQYSAFSNGTTGETFLYGRVAGRGGRAIGSAHAREFAAFPPLERTLETHSAEPAGVDLYNPACMPYPGETHLYLMFPSVFRHASDTLDIHLAVSRDGRNWTWPAPDSPFIPLGPSGSFDSGSLYMGNGGCLPTRDGWSLYYSGSPLRHAEVELDKLADPANRRVISRAVAQPDRLVSAAADPGGGRLTTTALIPGPGPLRILGSTSRHGSIRVEMVDAAGNPIAGFRARDCIPMSGDQKWGEVRWRPGIGGAPAPTGALRLIFELRDARIHGFRFGPT
ncbi:MAG: hypothetical protein ACKO5K_12295 [Armatimonadota bacterium]